MDRARRHRDVERGFDRLGERERIGDRAVARGAAGKARRLVDRRAGHELLDALVDITQSLLEPHHRLAVDSEAKVPGLDDAGMHRPDRDLMEALTLGGEEDIRGALGRGRAAGAERMGDAPEAEVEPGARIGKADGLQPVEALNGALEAHGRGMHRAYRRKAPARAFAG